MFAKKLIVSNFVKGFTISVEEGTAYTANAMNRLWVTPREIVVRLLAEYTDLSHLPNMQVGSRTHPGYHLLLIRCPFTGGKAGRV
jgi:hypothetical protein